MATLHCRQTTQTHANQDKRCNCNTFFEQCKKHDTKNIKAKSSKFPSVTKQTNNADSTVADNTEYTEKLGRERKPDDDPPWRRSAS